MLRPAQSGTIPSFDGTPIHYQVFGEGPSTILIGNGIGVGYSSLALQLEPLAQHHRVITWDHRGIFGSGAPGSGGVGVDAHAKDALKVLDTLNSTQAAYMGWSMGVQVGFELLRLASARISKVACLGGVAGNPFKQAIPIPGAQAILRRAVGGLSGLAPKLSPLARPFMRGQGALSVARLSGFVSPDVDASLFVDMVQGVASHDHRTYLQTLAALGAHDAEAILPTLEQPVLIIAGEKDRLVPKSALQRIAAMIPNARLHRVKGGSHFALIEKSGEVNECLLDFFSA